MSGVKAVYQASGLVAAVAGLVATAACFSSADKASSPDRCQNVSVAVVHEILGGAHAGVGTLQAVKAAAVQSADFDQVYMVAVKFTVLDIEGNQVGVWASNSLAKSGLIMSVDGVAQEFTDWPDAATTDAKITLTSDGVDAAKACVG